MKIATKKADYMKLTGQKIEGIYYFENEDDWALLKTNMGFFELRLGGIKKTSEVRSDDLIMDLPITGEIIKAAKTNDFSVYLELKSGGCIIHSDSIISGDGELSFGVDCLNEVEFKEAKDEWYNIEADLREIEYL